MTVHELDHGIIPMIARMQHVGMLVDTSVLDGLEQRLSEGMERALQQVHDHAGWWVNPDSPDQVGKLLFDQLGLRELDARGSQKQVRTTRTGKYKADKKALKPLQKQHPVVPLLLEYVELSTIRGIVRQVQDCVDEDGRVHPNLRITRVPTGRLSCNGVATMPGSKLNLLAIPTRSEIGREIRKAFVAPDGFELFTIDLDQIEMRVTADQAEDAGLIEAFNSGADVHSLSAASCFRIPLEDVTKAQRQIGKTVGFGVLNDMEAAGLLDQFGLYGIEGFTLEDCAGFIREWHRQRPEVARWKESFRAQAKRLGWVEDMWGRRRLVPQAQSPIERVRAEGVRSAVNHPIQSGAQGVIKNGMRLYWEQVRPRWRWVEPLLQVHDELIFYIPAGSGQEFGATMQMTLAEAGLERMQYIPVASKFAIGPTWGDLEK